VGVLSGLSRSPGLKTSAPPGEMKGEVSTPTAESVLHHHPPSVMEMVAAGET
jgi:hypothetical protein